MTEPPANKPTRKLKGKVVAVDSSQHPVYYRATQVGRCVPCYEPIAVGMRVGVLETRNEFIGNPPVPLFYAAKVEKIENGLITLRYENHPYAVSMVGAVKDLENFCVPLKSRK